MQLVKCRLHFLLPGFWQEVLLREGEVSSAPKTFFRLLGAGFVKRRESRISIQLKADIAF